MYFKQRENSALYKRYQHIEQQRLEKKIQEIKKRKLKRADSQNMLPPIIIARPHDKPYKIAMVQAETQRLSRKIQQLRTNRSQYFTKIIKVNIPSDRSNGKIQQLKNARLNQSQLVKKQSTE